MEGGKTRVNVSASAECAVDRAGARAPAARSTGGRPQRTRHYWQWWRRTYAASKARGWMERAVLTMQKSPAALAQRAACCWRHCCGAAALRARALGALEMATRALLNVLAARAMLRGGRG
jgi:hypothetical protein